VRVGPEGQPTRRRLARAAFGGREDEVVQAFIDARLLTSSELDGEPVVEVAHEALLRQWPPLTDAIERDREALQLRAELEREAQDWHRSGRCEEYLLSAERLAFVSHLSGSAQHSATGLTDLEQAFLTASRARQDLQEAAKRRRTRRAFTSLIGALLVISSLAVVAFLQERRAADQRDSAQATLWATNALGELATNPGESLALGMQAYAKKSTALTEGTLRVAASQATPQLVLSGNRKQVNGVAFTGDGHHLASAGADGTVRVWDWRVPRTPATILRSGRESVLGVAFERDGRHLASAGIDGTVRVWDWRARRTRPTVLRGPEREPGIRYAVLGVAFAGDGHHIAGIPEDGTVRVWDWRAPRTRPIILRSTGSIQAAVAFAGDGRHLASAGGEGIVRVWDWRAPRTRPIILRSGQVVVDAVAFTRDSRHLASAAASTVKVWDWRSPRARPTVLRGGQGSVSGVAFTRDGRHLATAREDRTVKVWDWR
jgi:WD40 repeat protein